MQSGACLANARAGEEPARRNDAAHENEAVVERVPQMYAPSVRSYEGRSDNTFSEASAAGAKAGMPGGRTYTVLMRYRYATAVDVPVLAEMNQQLIRDEGHRNRMSLGQLEDRMRGWLAGEYTGILFEDEQGVAGYALFKREPEWLHLRHFFIQPARRRQGIGRAAIEWLAANVWADVPRIRIDVLAGNAGGIQFWRSVGFQDYCMTMERGGTV